MPRVRRDGQITETATEARGGEAGPSMLLVLGISTISAGVVVAVLWYFYL